VESGRAVPVHYLRGNDSAWTPPQVITFDTETRQVADPSGETHLLRLWAARLDSRRPDSAGWTGTAASWGRTAGDLAGQVTEWCKSQRCVWAFAHNLSFDLTVAQLPAQLAAAGWTVTDHAAGSETPWLRLGRAGCTLTLADSWGWLRLPIGQVGALAGAVKPQLPAEDAPESEWLARCEADRDILARAMLEIMRWWDENSLGKWSLTGSHSGWNAMRHMMPRKRITVMTDPVQVEADREAIYGGRRECFRWGDLDDGPYAEYDFTAAYPTIAATMPLPSKRMYPFDSLPIDSPLCRGAGLGIIARVLVETGTPRYPCRAGGRVWYPAGRFWTTLAGPEIAEAHSRGELAEVGPGWAHGLGYALSEWARWVLAVQSGQDPTAPGVAIPMVKHWGRAVIGKFAARGFAKQEYGDAAGDRWSYLPVWDVGRQAHGAIVELGARRWKCLQTGAGDNCYPAVLAYVESHTRLRLARAVDFLGRGDAVCCDTDGLTAAGRASWDGLAAAVDTAPLQLRRKHVFKRIRVIGPQHLVRDGRRKFSGVPGSAVETVDGRLAALVWPRLAWQLREHPGDGYRRPAQEYVIGQSYASGWVTASGAVVPVEMRPGPGRSNRPVPWCETVSAREGIGLGPVQSPAVVRVFGMEA
jgi:hypothetical protein